MVPLQIKLPDNFLNEEIRCDYTVSSQMKEVWAVELDLLALVNRICFENDIKYFADSGTLLGAVRHKGFIPWDDDIDISMFRSDFEKFCKIAKKELKYPYFFQDEHTEPGSLRGHVKIMRLDTTAILKSEFNRDLNFSQGIFLDIFCNDNIPDDLQVREKFLSKLWLLRDKSKKLNCLTYRYNYKDDKSNKIKILLKILLKYLFAFFKIKNFYYMKIEKLAKKYENTPCSEVRILTYNDFNVGIYKKIDFKNCIQMPFEFININVPSGYEHILRQQYGDYMIFKPNLTAHGDIIFDTNVSYKEYLKNNK